MTDVASIKSMSGLDLADVRRGLMESADFAALLDPPTEETVAWGNFNGMTIVVVLRSEDATISLDGVVATTMPYADYKFPMGNNLPLADNLYNAVLNFIDYTDSIPPSV